MGHCSKTFLTCKGYRQGFCCRLCPACAFHAAICFTDTCWLSDQQQQSVGYLVLRRKQLLLLRLQARQGTVAAIFELLQLSVSQLKLFTQILLLPGSLVCCSLQLLLYCLQLLLHQSYTLSG